MMSSSFTLSWQFKCVFRHVLCQERRRAKDPEYFDRVHGSNPAQAREATAQEAHDNAHAQRRKEGEDLFTADAERRKERENA